VDISAYRQELRAQLATPELQRWRGVHRPDVAEELRLHAGLVATLHDCGLGRYGYPHEVGGLGGDVRHWAVLYDELARADLPIPEQYALMSTLVAPTLRFAPDLAARHLPAFLSGQEWWGQGFSEPEAGSDLAALRCRAIPVDGGWLVSGQKLWTSHGETAARIVLLARTGTQESRHRGLSMLLVDADSPGLRVRPLRLANGRAELAEVFLDDVLVASDRILGTEGGGWEVAMFLLQYERAVYAWLRACWLLQRLRALTGQVRPGHRSAQLLGEAYLDVTALRARSATTVQRLARGEAVGPEASADKVLLGTAEQSVHEAARRLLGAEFAFTSGLEPAAWRSEWWYSRMTTVYGGCAEVQRGILADHVLALPTS
jgi:alkylation response protein AidB-like acyl-CoA dehydrogenase